MLFFEALAQGGVTEIRRVQQFIVAVLAPVDEPATHVHGGFNQMLIATVVLGLDVIHGVADFHFGIEAKNQSSLVPLSEGRTRPKSFAFSCLR